MKFSTPVAFAILASIASALPAYKFPVDEPVSASDPKTIVLSNDDGWQALNIRATYRELTNAGYQVILSAPASQRSGWSGRFVLPTNTTMSTGGEFNYPPAGSPSWGHEENDTSIWYFDGTPASSVAFALEYLVPNYYNNTKVDLVVNGPNEGLNVSPGMFTISGTISATYNSVYRGVPAVAFSGSNGNNSFFADFADQEDDENLAANIYAKKVTEFVDALFKGAGDEYELLPVTTGLNVNFPKVGHDNESCTDPSWVYTRLSGKGSYAADLKYDEDSKLFVWTNGYYEPMTEKIFGIKTLQSEAEIINDDNCQTAVSAFSIDYDASVEQNEYIQQSLQGLF